MEQAQPSNVIRFKILFGLIFFSINAFAQQPMGEGIVKPRLIAGSVLHFYTGELNKEELKQILPPDSIVIKQGQYNLEITNSPEWFLPEIAKLDYDILQLRATTISRNWIEVIININTGKKAWVKRDSVDYFAWPDFLLSVFSVERTNPSQNPLRLKPVDNAAVVLNAGGSSLNPQAIRGDWMLVTIIDENTGNLTRTGWIKWKKGNQFLIKWSLLS